LTRRQNISKKVTGNNPLTCQNCIHYLHTYGDLKVSLLGIMYRPYKYFCDLDENKMDLKSPSIYGWDPCPANCPLNIPAKIQIGEK